MDLLTPDERARIGTLGTPPPNGDPDDVPTAVAAMILAAPLLSADRKPLEAVYGPAVDLTGQGAYVQALLAAGQVLVLSQWGRSSFMLTWAIGGLGFDGIRAVTAKTGGLPLALGAVCAGVYVLSSEKTRVWLLRSKAAMRTAGLGLLEVLAVYHQAEDAYRKLEAPLVEDIEALSPGHLAARAEAREAALERAAAALERLVVNSEALDEPTEALQLPEDT